MTFEKLKEIIVDTLNCDEEKVTPAASLQQDLEVDSLDVVELNMAIEEEVGASIPDEKLGELKTVADLLAMVNGLDG